MEKKKKIMICVHAECWSSSCNHQVTMTKWCQRWQVTNTLQKQDYVSLPNEKPRTWPACICCGEQSVCSWKSNPTTICLPPTTTFRCHLLRDITNGCLLAQVVVLPVMCREWPRIPPRKKAVEVETGALESPRKNSQLNAQSGRLWICMCLTWHLHICSSKMLPPPCSILSQKSNKISYVSGLHEHLRPKLQAKTPRPDRLANTHQAGMQANNTGYRVYGMKENITVWGSEVVASQQRRIPASQPTMSPRLLP